MQRLVHKMTSMRKPTLFARSVVKSKTIADSCETMCRTMRDVSHRICMQKTRPSEPTIHQQNTRHPLDSTNTWRTCEPARICLLDTSALIDSKSESTHQAIGVWCHLLTFSRCFSHIRPNNIVFLIVAFANHV